MYKDKPKLATRLLLVFLRDDIAEEVLGDLEEKFLLTVKNRSLFRARLNYWFQVFNYLRPFAVRRTGSVYINDYDMFKSYFRIGWRNILKYKTFSAINVFGLALAMSAGMLIILMISDQKEYDQFNEKGDRTYRIISKRLQSSKPNASSPFPVGAELFKDQPIVEATTTLALGIGGDAIYNEKTFEMRGFFAEPSFFNVFDYELKEGNSPTALERPNSLILTSEFARQVFGDQSPLGKTIQFVDRGLDIIQIGGKESPPVDWQTFVVTGVIDDKNYKSHLKFDALASSASMKRLVDEGKIDDIENDWATYSRAFTYVVLIPGKNASDLHAALNEVAGRKYADIEHLKGFQLIEQRLTEITPGLFLGNPTTLSLPIEVYYFLSVLAIAIILLACINYVYLSTARSLTRAKEIGIRKVVGAQRKSLISQFLIEAVLTTCLSTLLGGLLLFVFLKSAFLNLWVNRYLHFDLRPNAEVFLIFAGLALFVGLVSGSYPAFYLSRHRPVNALKASGLHQGKLRFSLRKVLSVSQLIVSLFFITTSILIFKQFRHFLAFDYQFSAENVINIPVQGNSYQRLLPELSAVPGVLQVSASSFVPASGMAHGASVRKSGSTDEFTHSEILHIDENFVSNLGLTVMAGRNLSGDDQASNRFLVNEAMVKALGYNHPFDIVDQMLDVGGYEIQVIGVVADFRFQPPMMSDRIGPLILGYKSDKFNFMNVRCSRGRVTETLAGLEEKWKSVDPVHPFKYKIYEEQLTDTNRALGDIVSVVGYVSVLALTIACLGLLGMTMYSTGRRTKEISIRKVLGATERGLTMMLSRQFLWLLVTSMLISAPLTYFINNLWLQNFPNKVDFGPDILLLGSLVLLVLGLLTITSQTVKAARSNPVDSLKAE
jgi:putative ABC transport system permease protein